MTSARLRRQMRLGLQKIAHVRARVTQKIQFRPKERAPFALRRTRRWKSQSPLSLGLRSDMAFANGSRADVTMRKGGVVD